MPTWTGVHRMWERVGPRVRDVTFIVIALLAGVGGALSRRHERPEVWVAFLLMGVVGAVALWWRRRSPVVITLIGIAVVLVTRLPVVLSIALFSLAIRRRDRVTAAMTLAAAASFAIAAAADGSQSAPALVVVGCLQAGFCTAIGSYVGARRDLVTALRERADRAESERELRAEQARLSERARIAREMHDVLAHKVSLIALHAGALEVNPTADTVQVHRAAGLIRSTAREAMEDLREVLGVLRAGANGDDAPLAPQPVLADVERIVETSRAAGVQTELTIRATDLPDAAARTVYRVVREGLTNVHKHARGAATSVTIAGDEVAGVTVEVVNERPVASTALLPGSGSGLLGLSERLALVGGSFRCGPCAGGGWAIRAWLPWSAGQVAPVQGVQP